MMSTPWTWPHTGRIVQWLAVWPIVVATLLLPEVALAHTETGSWVAS